jgi:hypothetical protein
VAALGEARLVNEDQTIRFGSVRCSTPPGHVGDRVHGSKLIVVGRRTTVPARRPGNAGRIVVLLNRSPTTLPSRISTEPTLSAPPRQPPALRGIDR